MMKKFLCLSLCILLSALYAETINLEFIKSNGTVTSRKFDSEIKDLNFGLAEFTAIRGLEKLSKLKSITFENMVLMNDFTFLSGLRIERLIIVDCKINNFNFLKNLLELKFLQIDGCKIHSTNINLENCTKLKYLQFSNIYFENSASKIIHPLPLQNIPGSLKVLNYSYNDIENLRAEDVIPLRNIPLILIGGNKIKTIGTYKNFKIDVLTQKEIDEM